MQWNFVCENGLVIGAIIQIYSSKQTQMLYDIKEETGTFNNKLSHFLFQSRIPLLSEVQVTVKNKKENHVIVMF